MAIHLECCIAQITPTGHNTSAVTIPHLAHYVISVSDVHSILYLTNYDLQIIKASGTINNYRTRRDNIFGYSNRIEPGSNHQRVKL